MKKKFTLMLIAILTVLSISLINVCASETPVNEDNNHEHCIVCGDEECTCEDELPPIMFNYDPFPNGDFN